MHHQIVVFIIFFDIPQVDLNYQQTCPGKAEQNWRQAVQYMDQLLPTKAIPHTRGSESSPHWLEQACSLDAMHIDRSDTEIKILVRALNIVACAFRPLDVGELIEALTTQIPPLIECQDWQGDASWLRTSEDLKSLCLGFLEIGDSGVVQFSDRNLKNSVLSHEFAKLNLPCGSDGHELLAMVCIQHLQCLPPGKLLRPWIAATHWQTEAKHECALRSYTKTFWHEHSRIALVYSREVPAMLHRAFMSAISSEEDYELTSSEKINMALWLSTVNSFHLLCRTYLEMGADPNWCSNCHEAPIHAAARSATGDVIRLLIDRGADLDLRNEEGLAPLHIACRSGNLEAAQTFIEFGADLDTETPADTTAYKGARTPLHHAIICGQLEVVQMLLSQPRLGRHGLRQIKVELEDLGSNILAFVFSCVKEEDRHYVMDLLDFERSIMVTGQVIRQGQNAPLVQPDPVVASDHQPEVVSLGHVFAEVVNFILLPARESFGPDAETQLRFSDSQNCQQEIRYVTGKDDTGICLSQKNIRKRNVSLQPPLDTHNYTRFAIYYWSRLSKLVDRIDLLQFNHMIDVLRNNFALVALHTDNSLEGDIRASLEKAIEGSGVLPWVRYFCTTQAANSQIQERDHAPELSPAETHIVAGVPEPAISIHEFSSEGLLITHARQQFMAEVDIEDIDKRDEGFVLPANEPDYVPRSEVNRGSHTVR
jgi:ankyrin repeat protein